MCHLCDDLERHATDESPKRLAALAALGRSLPPITSMVCPVCDRVTVVTIRDHRVVTGAGAEWWASARANYRAENSLPAE